jgi:4-hydroxyphenylpyruvate dioxygenase-like putative hemolysin
MEGILDTKFGYFSLAVTSITEATELYTKMLGLEVIEPPEESVEFGFMASRLGIGKNSFLELLESTNETSAVARFIKSRGEGVYLISLAVDNLKDAVRQVRASGGRITGIDENEEPGPDTTMVWIHPTTRGYL